MRFVPARKKINLQGENHEIYQKIVSYVGRNARNVGRRHAAGGMDERGKRIGSFAIRVGMILRCVGISELPPDRYPDYIRRRFGEIVRARVDEFALVAVSVQYAYRFQTRRFCAVYIVQTVSDHDGARTVDVCACQCVFYYVRFFDARRIARCARYKVKVIGQSEVFDYFYSRIFGFGRGENDALAVFM